MLDCGIIWRIKDVGKRIPEFQIRFRLNTFLVRFLLKLEFEKKKLQLDVQSSKFNVIKKFRKSKSIFSSVATAYLIVR
jgi:hypothetical protein